MLAIVIGENLALVLGVPKDFETAGRRTDLVLVIDDADRIEAERNGMRLAIAHDALDLGEVLEARQHILLIGNF